MEPVQFKKFSRFAVEEVMRRAQKNASEPIGKKQILKLLVPNSNELVDELKATTQKKIEKKMERGDAVGGAGPYAAFEAQAAILRA